MMQGKWIFNNKDGSLAQIGNFKNDLKNGDVIRYNSDDEVIYHEVFNEGKLVEKLV